MGEGLQRAVAAARRTQLPDVRVGQVWAHNDKRMDGRFVRVEMLCEEAGHVPYVTGKGDAEPHAHVTQCTADGGRFEPYRRQAIRLRRFTPNSTGYRLVKEGPDA